MNRENKKLVEMMKNKKIFELLRDGKSVARGTEIELMNWVHANHSFSFDWALKFEGYSVIEASPSVLMDPDLDD